MICPNCQTINESENVFCVNCGATVTQAGNVFHDTKAPTVSFQNPLPSEPSQSAAPTEVFQNSANVPPPQFGQAQPPPTQVYNTSNSVETSVVPQYGAASMHNFAPSASFPVAPERQAENNTKKMFLWAGLIFFGLVAAGIGGFFLLDKQSIKSEMLPEHLGMFLQSKEKDKIDEIKKQDFTNALDGKDKLLKDDSLASAESDPNLILYSDSKEISLSDLRLIQLDTIKPDGSLKQIEFQAAPVDGKPEMKRIRIPEGLANGKYAFTIFDGYLDDGKHKFWAFQVKNSDKTNNDSTLKSTTVSIKSKQNTTSQTNNEVVQKPIVPAPSGATTRYLNIGNVVLRSGPSQTYSSVGKLSAGQKVYVIGYSSEYETFVSPRTGKSYYSNYAQVQLENGKQGWVYAAFLN